MSEENENGRDTRRADSGDRETLYDLEVFPELEDRVNRRLRRQHARWLLSQPSCHSRWRNLWRSAARKGRRLAIGLQRILAGPTRWLSSPLAVGLFLLVCASIVIGFLGFGAVTIWNEIAEANWGTEEAPSLE